MMIHPFAVAVLKGAGTGQAAQVPIGTAHIGLQKPPSGQWLACGASYPSADYSALYDALGLPEQGTWVPTTRYMPRIAEWSDIAYAPAPISIFVAIARGTDLAATSPDGITWTLRTLPVSGDWVGVVFGAAVFSTVARGTDVVLTSSDGITWTPGVLPVQADWDVGGIGSMQVGPVARAAPFFVSGADDAVVFLASGVWTKSAASLPVVGRLGGATRGGGGASVLSIALPLHGNTALVASRVNGAWTSRTLPATAWWRSVAYGNGVYVAVATGGDIAATSLDGITWTLRTLPTVAAWSCVVFGAGQFIALAGGDIAATSPDGITWILRTLPLALDWSAGAYQEGLFAFIASGTNGAATLPVALPTFLVPPAVAVASPYKQWVKAG